MDDLQAQSGLDGFNGLLFIYVYVLISKKT